MSAFKDLAHHRRSHRSYDGRPIDPDDLSLILRAALLSPSSKHRQSWYFTVVEDKMMLEKLADAKENGARFVAQAAVAVVVSGSPEENDCWIEDGSIAAFAMQLQAGDLGIGSCWVQIRGRHLGCGTSSESVVRGILGIPDSHGVLCILTFGHPSRELPTVNEEKLKWENVHLSHF